MVDDHQGAVVDHPGVLGEEFDHPAVGGERFIPEADGGLVISSCGRSDAGIPAEEGEVVQPACISVVMQEYLAEELTRADEAIVREVMRGNGIDAAAKGLAGGAWSLQTLRGRSEGVAKGLGRARHRAARPVQPSTRSADEMEILLAGRRERGFARLGQEERLFCAVERLSSALVVAGRTLLSGLQPAGVAEIPQGDRPVARSGNDRFAVVPIGRGSGRREVLEVTEQELGLYTGRNLHDEDGTGLFGSSGPGQGVREKLGGIGDASAQEGAEGSLGNSRLFRFAALHDREDCQVEASSSDRECGGGCERQGGVGAGWSIPRRRAGGGHGRIPGLFGLREPLESAGTHEVGTARADIECDGPVRRFAGFGQEEGRIAVILGHPLLCEVEHGLCANGPERRITAIRAAERVELSERLVDATVVPNRHCLGEPVYRFPGGGVMRTRVRSRTGRQEGHGQRHDGDSSAETAHRARHYSELKMSVSLRALLLLSLLAVVIAASPGCRTSNLGGLFDPPGSGGGDGGDPPGGGEPPGPGYTPGDPSAPIDGALVLDGRPTISSVAAAPSGAVDVDTLVGVWFSESVNSGTVNSSSLGLRLEGGGAVSARYHFLLGDRLLVLEPYSPLSPGQVYELFATESVRDLDGDLLSIPETGVASSFVTATDPPDAPVVVATYPPAGTTDQPNHYSAVLLFSRSIDSLSVSGQIAIESAGVGADFATNPTFSADTRMLEYEHGHDANDLGATLELTVGLGLRDTQEPPSTLSTPDGEPYQASWATIEFPRPASVGVAAGVINRANVGSLLVDVGLLGAPILGDSATVLITEAAGGTQAAVGGDLTGVTTSFLADLTDTDGLNLFGEGQLALGSFVERGDLRSTLRVDHVLQDTEPPYLVEFGAPSASYSHTFLTDLPELRPYGLANETIASIGVTFVEGSSTLSATRSAPVGAEDSFFWGPAHTVADPFVHDTLGREFGLLLTDAAGNSMDDYDTGRVRWFGLVGPVPVTDSVRVVAFDEQSLEPVVGARVYIENTDGSAPDYGKTGTDGSILFSGRLGAQNVTVHDGEVVGGTVTGNMYHAVSALGFDSDLLSLPMRHLYALSEVVSPTIYGMSGGTIDLASPLLRDFDEAPRIDALRSATLPLSLFSTIYVRPERPGWFGAFYTDLAAPLAAIDPRRVVPPSGGGLFLGATPQLSMVAFDPGTPITWTTATGDPTTVGVVASLPGHDGVIPIGVGAGGSGFLQYAVADAVRTAVAAESGHSDPADLPALVQIYHADTGNKRLARLSENDPAAALDLPSLPTVAASGGAYPAGVSLQFTDTLGTAGTPGLYHLVLTDQADASWDLWLPAGSYDGVGSVGLPTLSDGAIADPPPLDTLPGSSWTLSVAAWGLPPGSAETGLFFRALPRDCVSWAATAPSPGFHVDS